MANRLQDQIDAEQSRAQKAKLTDLLADRYSPSPDSFNPVGQIPQQVSAREKADLEASALINEKAAQRRSIRERQDIQQNMLKTLPKSIPPDERRRLALETAAQHYRTKKAQEANPGMNPREIAVAESNTARQPLLQEGLMHGLRFGPDVSNAEIQADIARKKELDAERERTQRARQMRETFRELENMFLSEPVVNKYPQGV